MTGWILVILVFMVGMLAWTSAIKQALLGTSDGALERRLAELGRLERSRWIIGRQRSLASYLAVKCAAQSALITGVVVLDLCGIGEGAVLDPWRLTFSVLIATVLIWFSTGVIGPALARYIGSGLITAILPLLRLAFPIMGPFARITSVFDESVRRLTGANLLERDAEEELLRSIEDSQRKGGLDDVAVEMLENVVEFADTDVSSVMTPRTDIDGIAFTDELSEIRSFIESAGHSRIPVYSENLDSIEGILYVKDLVRYLGEDAASFRLRPLLREAIRVPETKQVGDLLRDFQSAEIHMAIVIDEYGGTSGLVTIEDVLEEIVGEIHDEHLPTVVGRPLAGGRQIPSSGSRRPPSHRASRGTGTGNTRWIRAGALRAGARHRRVLRGPRLPLHGARGQRDQGGSHPDPASRGPGCGC